MAEIAAATHSIVLEALTGKQQKSLLAAKFERLARYDSLTGVENRMAMQMRIRDMFDACDGERAAISVIWMDVDRSQDHNESLGHMVGDHLLTAVAEKNGDEVGGRRTISHFGGEELIIKNE